MESKRNRQDKQRKPRKKYVTTDKRKRFAFLSACEDLGVNSHTAYSWWRNPQRIPPHKAIEIERLTDGKISLMWMLFGGKQPDSIPAFRRFAEGVVNAFAARFHKSDMLPFISLVIELLEEVSPADAVRLSEYVESVTSYKSGNLNTSSSGIDPDTDPDISSDGAEIKELFDFPK